MITWQSFLLIILAGLSFSYSAYRFSVLYRLMSKQQGTFKQIDRLFERVMTFVFNVLGQKAVLQKQPIGTIHFIIFWGFIIISVGTLEQFSSTLLEGVNFEFIGETAYSLLVFVQDILSLGVLLAVGYAAYRRFVIRPIGLGKSHDANIVLTLTGSLMVAIFFMNGFHILAHSPWYANSMPLSQLFGKELGLLNFSQDQNKSFALFFKWVHMLIVLGFSIYIPSSKHLHIIAAGPNTFLKTLNREKAMKPISFDDPNASQFGAAKITDLSWKDTLDFYSCTECGRCQDLCPAFNTNKPLSPKMLILDLKNNLYKNKSKILDQKYTEVSSIIDEHVSEDVIWACTSCRACEIACPVFIDHTDKIYEIRRNLVMMESKFPTEVQSVFKNMETNSSPWAFSPTDRGNWAQNLSIKSMSEKPEIDYLLWVGCAGSFDDRNKKVLTAFASLMKKSGVKFAILGQEEQCTGDPARRIGNEYLFQTLAKANVETLRRYDIKKIVTACPHCFNTLKNEYPDFGGNYEVLHHSQLIADLINQAKLKPTKALEETVTFHDSCYLGRWNNVYQEPRKALNSLPAINLVEMKNSHDKSLCCGAGGGRMWMEEKLGERINITRTEQALKTGAGVLASSCPFCLTMLTDGVKAKEIEDKVKVLDIAEILDQATP